MRTSPVKKLVLAALLLSAPVPAIALEAELDKYDVGPYDAVASTSNVLYLKKCARKALKQFNWKIWAGDFGVKAFIQPVATIIVKKDDLEYYGVSINLFIEKAIETSASIGGNIVCYMSNTYKKGKDTVGPAVIKFRAYRQIFLSGHDGLVTFYNERMNEGFPLTEAEAEKYAR